MLSPVNPNAVPTIDTEVLLKYPRGHRFLAYCQEQIMGVKVLADMPGHKRDVGTGGVSSVCGEKHDQMYWQCKTWIEGKEMSI